MKSVKSSLDLASTKSLKPSSGLESKSMRASGSFSGLRVFFFFFLGFSSLSSESDFSSSFAGFDFFPCFLPQRPS